MSVPLEELRVEARNYGSRRRPRFTVEAELRLRLQASPDHVHSAMVEERLISYETVPTATVVNFRGSSTGGLPYYSALIEHRGSILEYRVDPVYTGWMANVSYTPTVHPASLKHLHPVGFKSAGVKVLSFKLCNYKFTSGLKRYEELRVEAFGEEEGPSTVRAFFKESGLESKEPPCSRAFQAFERSLAKLGSPPLASRILEAYEKEK